MLRSKLGGVLIVLSFIISVNSRAVAQNEGVQSQSDSITQKCNAVIQSGNVINKLDGATPLKTPVGLSSEGCKYAIVIDKVEITEKGGFFDASASIELPGSGKSICFLAKRVPFTASGGLNGIARLELVTNCEIPLLGGAKLQIPKDGKTYVEFDCNGFKQLALSADILFDPSLLVPATSGEKQLKSHIETVIKDANDFMVSLSISPFHIKGLEEYTFTVKEASWDQSDYANPTGLTFPANYSNPLYSSNPTLWRGFFMKNIEVTLPGYLNGSSKEPLIVSADNLLYDETGVSGIFSASPILPLEKGNIPGGFALSINKATLEISQNELTKGSLSGYIRLPISSKDTIGYTATADVRGKFVFTAVPTDTLNFDIWKAKAKIAPSSSIVIASDENGIVIKTLLNGNLSISAPVVEGSKKTLDMSVPFEELYLSNRSPYFEVKAFGINNLNASQSFAGFSYSINSIGFSCKNEKAGLKVDLDVSIGGNGSNAFSAGGLVELKAARKDSKWKFDGVELEKFRLATEFSGFKLKGELAMFNDSKQYGDGISGNIEMTLTTLNFEVGAAAIFGKVDGYRYWYADAFASVKIPVGTGLVISSLGGGAFSKMRQGSPANKDEDYGRGSSGICYIPDKKLSFGFMAKVGLATVDGKIVNGDAAFEMAFNEHGGISYISFLGHAKIMALGKAAEAASQLKEKAGKFADVIDGINQKTSGISDKLSKAGVVKAENAVDLREKADAIATEIKKNDAGAPITATLYSIFDFDNGCFFAKLEATINVLGIIKGVNPGGSAGEMVMYFGKDKWYVHCGTPKVPIGLELLGIARTKSYFMMGHDLPPFPEPPAKVLDIIGIGKVDRSRDISSLAGGKGIAFGASLEMDTGKLQFLMFYAQFAAGMGFDVMLKDYGKSQCAGSDGPIGLNGWYAMGQSWAYVQGEIGIRVKMMFVKGNFPILKMGVGTLLEAQLPNPCWFHGAVGGYYNILGGLVKGKCKFEFELGKKCKIKSNAKDLLANMNVISDIRPTDGGSDISVFSKPQAVFSMPVNKSFAIDAPDGYRYQFRAKLDRFVALNNGVPIVGEMQYNEDSTVVTIKPHCILPGKKSITVSCELSFEEFKKGGWSKVMDEGRPVTEAKAVTFTTGAAPDFIPEDNVTIEYPIHGQEAFYKDEYSKGFVVLDIWQDNLFGDSKFKTYALFKTGEQVVAKTEVTTVYDRKQIHFNIPQSMLATSTAYNMVLINEPVDKNTSIDKNVEKKEVAVKEDEGDVGELTVTSRNAKADLVIAEDKVLYAVPFKTSMFKTFGNKVDNLSTTIVGRRVSQMSMVPLLLNTLSESFDKVEKEGSRTTANEPLISFYSSLSDNYWFSTKVEPFVYVDYPFLKIGVVDRDINKYGIYPYKAISFEEGTNNIFYNVPFVAKKDYGQVRDKVSKYFVVGNISDEQKQRVNMLIGIYPNDFYVQKNESKTIIIKYILPNGMVTSEKSIVFYYKKYE